MNSMICMNCRKTMSADQFYTRNGVPLAICKKCFKERQNGYIEHRKKADAGKKQNTTQKETLEQNEKFYRFPGLPFLCVFMPYAGEGRCERCILADEEQLCRRAKCTREERNGEQGYYRAGKEKEKKKK